jgi:hypothetical protein
MDNRFFVSTRPCLPSFRELCWPGLLPVRSCRRHRGLQSSHTWARIPFEPIAWREHLRLAVGRPLAGLGGSGTAGVACPSHSARHPRRTVKPSTQWDRDFAVCAVNRFIASAGTSTSGAAVQTRMRSGTALAWSLGNSGMRQVVRSDFCGACRRGAVAKPAVAYGRTQKLTTAYRCSGFGASTATRPGPSCSTFGACRTFR